MTDLTRAEFDVIRALAECGGSTKEAATKLGISRSTIRTHRYNITAKFGCNLTELWKQLGWLQVPTVKPDYSKYDWRHRHDNP